ncbi:hypothetical protein ABW19_dt0204616 [Dactylella cylindrospora]|nr:hypothetical protein ABW19_dt0204616 [Dactylella cylindrospora]
MGQLFSKSPYEYTEPWGFSSPPPWFIYIRDFIGSTDPDDYRRFHYDIDDPHSLVRELQKHHMVGIVDRWADPPKLYLIGYDEMPTSVIRRGSSFSVVYPPNLSNEARLYVGGQALRELVGEHEGFPQVVNDDSYMEDSTEEAHPQKRIGYSTSEV